MEFFEMFILFLGKNNMVIKINKANENPTQIRNSLLQKCVPVKPAIG